MRKRWGTAIQISKAVSIEVAGTAAEHVSIKLRTNIMRYNFENHPECHSGKEFYGDEAIHFTGYPFTGDDIANTTIQAMMPRIGRRRKKESTGQSPVDGAINDAFEESAQRKLIRLRKSWDQTCTEVFATNGCPRWQTLNGHMDELELSTGCPVLSMILNEMSATFVAYSSLQSSNPYIWNDGTDTIWTNLTRGCVPGTSDCYGECGHWVCDT